MTSRAVRPPRDRHPPCAGPADLRRDRPWRGSNPSPASRLTPASPATAPHSTRRCCSPIAACPAPRSCRSPATGARRDDITVDLLPGRSADPSCAKPAQQPGHAQPVDGAGRPAAQPAGRSTGPRHTALTGNIADCSDAAPAARSPHRLTHWQLHPTGTEGYRTAEVTAGRCRHRRAERPHDGKQNRPRPLSSSARSSMSPAGSAATISSGPGHRAGLRAQPLRKRR